MSSTLTEGLVIGSDTLPRLQLYFAEFLAVNAGLKYHKYLTKSHMKAATLDCEQHLQGPLFTLLGI